MILSPIVDAILKPFSREVLPYIPSALCHYSHAPEELWSLQAQVGWDWQLHKVLFHDIA